MVSNINTTIPADGVPADKSLIRQNFAYAKTEIEALQAAINPAQVPGSPTPALTIDAFRGMRNRLINGAMLHAQVAREVDTVNYVQTINAGECKFGADRWGVYNATGSGCVFQTKMHAGTSGLAEFPNFLRVQTTTARGSAWGDNQQCTVFQGIEGYNIADWLLGSANAKPLFLSFWVRSTIAGNFGASIRNARGAGQNYPFGFTINAANVWERKTVAVPAVTAGTWASNTDMGLMLAIDLGSSNAQRTSAEAWTASLFHGKTGAISIGSTLNAYIDITGMQLTAETADTPFDHRMYPVELLLCARYAFALQNTIYATAYADVPGRGMFTYFPFLVPLRVWNPVLSSYTDNNRANVASTSIVHMKNGGAHFQITATAAGYMAAQLATFWVQAEYTT